MIYRHGVNKITIINRDNYNNNVCRACLTFSCPSSVCFMSSNFMPHEFEHLFVSHGQHFQSSRRKRICGCYVMIAAGVSIRDRIRISNRVWGRVKLSCSLITMLPIATSADSHIRLSTFYPWPPLTQSYCGRVFFIFDTFRL